MDEKELTRLEMATLLFVNDQHHSQLLEQMPEKSGMTGHGKDLFEPTLRDVADKKTATFEPGGGPQQGTYIPKGEKIFSVVLKKVCLSVKHMLKKLRLKVVVKYLFNVVG